jgi:hypothetical protein
METGLNADDRKRVEESIRQKYARVSESPEGLFSYPTGRLKQAGFVDVELFAETGINSSPVTKGVLIRANKPKVF